MLEYIYTFSVVVLLSFWGQLYETWITYPADKSLKHNSAIQALNSRTLILPAE